MGDADIDILPSETISLLDTLVKTKNSVASRSTILHRVFVVAKLRASNRTKVGEYYESMFKGLIQPQASLKTQNPFVERVTGIIITYPTLFIMVAESSCESIRQILADVHRQQDEPDGMIQDAKILNYSHEIHMRLFPPFIAKNMNLSLEHDSSEPSDTPETLVSDIITRLVRLGKFMLETGRNKKDIIETLHDSNPEFFPNQSFANFLLKNEHLLTAKEYLAYYEKPLDLILESELTWPAPSKLFPYQ